jgi:hypothetical protein
MLSVSDFFRKRISLVNRFGANKWGPVAYSAEVALAVMERMALETVRELRVSKTCVLGGTLVAECEVRRRKDSPI